MKILNYTTKIDADRTAMEIAKCLSMHGAQAVLTEYDPVDNYVTGISFKIKVGEQSVGFKLPVDWKPVYEILMKDKQEMWRWDSKKRSNLESNMRLQAVRTAWRIVKDWVEAQMALVDTKMVNTGEVFLPYAVMKDGRTLSSHVAENPKFLLGDGT